MKVLRLFQSNSDKLLGENRVLVSRFSRQTSDNNHLILSEFTNNTISCHKELRQGR